MTDNVGGQNMSGIKGDDEARRNLRDVTYRIATMVGLSPEQAIHEGRQKMPVVPVTVGDDVILMLAVIERLAARVAELEKKQ